MWSYLAFLQVPIYHLVLETFLLGWVVWLLIKRYQKSTGKHSESNIKLTKAEEDGLIASWKPEPLVPDNEVDGIIPVVIQGKAGSKVNVDGIDCWNFSTQNYLGLVGRQDIGKYS